MTDQDSEISTIIGFLTLQDPAGNLAISSADAKDGSFHQRLLQTVAAAKDKALQVQWIPVATTQHDEGQSQEKNPASKVGGHDEIQALVGFLTLRDPENPDVPFNLQDGWDDLTKGVSRAWRRSVARIQKVVPNTATTTTTNTTSARVFPEEQSTSAPAGVRVLGEEQSTSAPAGVQQQELVDLVGFFTLRDPEKPNSMLEFQNELDAFQGGISHAKNQVVAFFRAVSTSTAATYLGATDQPKSVNLDAVSSEKGQEKNTLLKEEFLELIGFFTLRDPENPSSTLDVSDDFQQVKQQTIRAVNERFAQCSYPATGGTCLSDEAPKQEAITFATIITQPFVIVEQTDDDSLLDTSANRDVEASADPSQCMVDGDTVQDELSTMAGFFLLVDPESTVPVGRQFRDRLAAVLTPVGMKCGQLVSKCSEFKMEVPVSREEMDILGGFLTCQEPKLPASVFLRTTAAASASAPRSEAREGLQQDDEKFDITSITFETKAPVIVTPRDDAIDTKTNLRIPPKEVVGIPYNEKPSPERLASSSKRVVTANTVATKRRNTDESVDTGGESSNNHVMILVVKRSQAAE